MLIFMNDAPVLFQEMSTASQHIIGVITLNDPRSLNALSLEMIQLMYKKLQIWRQQEKIVCVVLQGAGNKAFCAGGNIRTLYDSIQDSKFGKNAYAEQFFIEEYQLDYLIHRYTKPIVCLGHGFVMGGGIGLMSGASHRIVRENSVLAMPEISIGLYPDVGSSWFLSRMIDGLGAFIGMTGVRMKAGDALFVGLADYCLENETFASLVDQLQLLHWHDHDAQNKSVLDQYLAQAARCKERVSETAKLKINHELIQKMVHGYPPHKVLANLLTQQDSWWVRCADTLKKGCPVSAWIVFEQIRRAATMTLEDVFRMELDISIQCTRHKDLYEGIRALIVEKDDHPCWEDDDLISVTTEKIHSFFISPWSRGDHPLSCLEKK